MRDYCIYGNSLKQPTIKMSNYQDADLSASVCYIGTLATVARSQRCEERVLVDDEYTSRSRSRTSP